MKTAVVLLSGGMDSTTLAYWLRDQGFNIHAVSVNYGQRHEKELEFASRTAEKLLAVGHTVFDLSAILEGLISQSALTGDVGVPEGHYAQENMKLTVVPNRNMLLLSLAGAIAANKRYQYVATAVHAGDHFVYPDCRPMFVRAMQEAFWNAIVPETYEGLVHPVRLLAPFLYNSKADIAAKGDRLGVSWEDTWSCYKGGDIHCGRCGTCVERAEAFALANVADPTVYESPDYWREAVAKATT